MVTFLAPFRETVEKRAFPKASLNGSGVLTTKIQRAADGNRLAVLDGGAELPIPRDLDRLLF
jgi:hypothetical protein